MFWEFGIVSSEIEDILDKENESTLENLLDEPELLQEINAKNARLIDYCSREEIVNRIFSYVITEPDPSIEECNRYKYPMLCSEILTAGVASFDHVLIDDASYLLRLFATFNQTNLNILICNFMVKILVYLVSEYPEKFHKFVVTNNVEIVDILLNHVEYSSICDAILKLQSHELTTEMRTVYIELLYEQNIIGKLYRMINYNTPNVVKSAACNLFVEIIRIHRIRPTLFLDNFKYTENMVLVEQAQSDNLLQLLLDNMFEYATSSSSSSSTSSSLFNVPNSNNDSDSNEPYKYDKNYEQWLNIGRTINYGCIVLLSLFDSTRISDSYGDEFNEFGYIRNTVLIVVATDFKLLSSNIKKFVNYLHLTIIAKVNTMLSCSLTNDDGNSSSSSSTTMATFPFGTTNVNIVRLLTVLTIFQCESVENAIIESELFVILWRFLPYFSRNNAFHSLLFDCVSFILLSDLYVHAPTHLAQNTFPKESVLAHLKMRYDFANPSYAFRPESCVVAGDSSAGEDVSPTNNRFLFGSSILLYNYLINDIQILLVALRLYETCCHTVRCDFRGHLMQLVTKFSKLPPTTLIPTNPNMCIVPSFLKNSDETTNNCSDRLSVTEIVQQKWEFFCSNIAVPYIKDNEIDPNVFTANNFHEDHLDNLFRSFDSNFTSNQDDQNGSFSFNNNDGDTMALQANVKIEVEQGLNYMESVKQSLLFGADNVKFPSRFMNGSKNAFICSSDDEYDVFNDCLENDVPVSDDRVPSLYSSDKKTPSSPMHYGNVGDDHSREFAADIQGEVVRGDAEEENFEKSRTESSTRSTNNSNLEQNISNVNKSITIDDRMTDPYDNSFDFGEKNANYIQSVMNDSVSRRLECSSGPSVFSSDNSTTNLSSASVCDDHSTFVDPDHVATAGEEEEIVKFAFNLFSPNPYDRLPPPMKPSPESFSCYSDMDDFYSLPSNSEIGSSDINTDKLWTTATQDNNSGDTLSNHGFSSLSDNLFLNDSTVDKKASFGSENIEPNSGDQELFDRKGTSSPLKHNLSHNSEEMEKDEDDDEEEVFCPKSDNDPPSCTDENTKGDDCEFYRYDFL